MLKKFHIGMAFEKFQQKPDLSSNHQKKQGRKRCLTEKDEFLLTLMKLRLGSTNIDLAHRFGISATTVTNIFTTWLKVMAQELSCLIYNPSKESILQSMPKSFKKAGFTKVRHTIDCTEIFIETPNDPMLKAATWSDYKHHYTTKVIVAISPNGAFTFISKAWVCILLNNLGFMTF